MLAAKPPVSDAVSAGDDPARLDRGIHGSGTRRAAAGALSMALAVPSSSQQRSRPIPPGHSTSQPSPRGSIPIEPAAPLLLHLPRLRALAVLRRRPSVCGARPAWPASANLHKPGRTRPSSACRMSPQADLAGAFPETSSFSTSRANKLRAGSPTPPRTSRSAAGWSRSSRQACNSGPSAAGLLPRPSPPAGGGAYRGHG